MKNKTIIIDGSSSDRISDRVFLMLKHHHKFCFASKRDGLYTISCEYVEERGISEDAARAMLEREFCEITAEIVIQQMRKTDFVDFIDVNA